MITAELKRKLRKLKKFENTVRLQNSIGENIPLVWDKYFNLHETGKSTALYTLSELVVLDKDEYKTVIDEFFARVYYEVYVHKGIIDAPIYDPVLLEKLGLSAVANEADLKKKFRELAKKHHPDTGGDAEKFIELMKVYKELM